LAAIVVLVHLGLAGIAYAQADTKQVLVLYSTRPDAQLSIVGESQLPRILEAGVGQRVVYYSEFIDVATFPQRAHLALHEFLRLKYEGIRFDLVVAIQSEAIEFVDGHRNTLFRDTPAVFLTNDPSVRRLSNSTGLIHERDLAQPSVHSPAVQPGFGTSSSWRGPRTSRRAATGERHPATAAPPSPA
jgi:hypothetical protein